MAEYRQKPIIVEAVSCAEVIKKMGYDHSWTTLPPWVIDAYEKGNIRAITEAGLLISVFEKKQWAGHKDMIVYGPYGELSSCTPKFFEATYDAVIYEEDNEHGS